MPEVILVNCARYNQLTGICQLCINLGDLCLDTDRLGHLVLKKVQVDCATWLETVYLYDDVGNLKYQVSPEGVKRIKNGTASWNNAFVETWTSSYTYDSRNRLVEKQAPGAKPVYMVYDKLDRLVLVQNGRMRRENKWRFTKFDVASRLVLEGIYTDLRARATIQDERDSSTGALSEEKTGASSSYYTNNAFPSGNSDITSISYYDNYDFNNDGINDYSYTNPGVTGATSANAIKNTGFLTGTKKKVPGTSNWLLNVTFYDEDGNAIQKISNNLLNSAVQDVTSNIFDVFTGKLLATKQVKQTSTSISVINKMEYDHMDGITKITVNIDGGADQVIARYEYNELGQLKDKKLHQKSDGSYLQSVDYSYNIRGWLTGINNSTLTVDAGTNDDSNDIFGMSFMYNSSASGLNNNTYYNGKIAAIKWKTNDVYSHSATPVREQAYKYTYDGVDRLRAANYIANSGSAWNADAGAYDEIISNYDANGNILGLQRYSQNSASSSPVLIDNLSFTFKHGGSNQLSAVSDASANIEGFKDGASTAAEYDYDDNGNLSKDLNKGISTILYNDLDKTSKVIYTDGRTIDYIYDAGGTRVRKIVTAGQVTTYDYIEGFVFTNANLSYFATAEGRVRKGGSYTYEYFIKDHLGSSRVSFVDNGNGVARIVQENHYYAFGMTMKGFINRTAVPSDPNRQLFNGGSELQDDFGEESSYSTFFREYDPVLGRFNAIDPMVDKYGSWSPYNFAFNDPIGLNDPLGDDAESLADIAARKRRETEEDVNKSNALNPGFRSDVWTMVESAWNTAAGGNMSFKFNDGMITGSARIVSMDTGDGAIYITRGSFYSEMSPGGISGSFFVEVINNVKPANKGGGWLDNLQTGLDVVGLVPGFGEIADGLNAAIYAGRGDYVNAGLSVAAMVPLVGMAATGGKFVNKALKLSDTKTALKKVHDIMGGSLPKGAPGKFGSPQRGTSLKGYRLDPAHPGRPFGHPESVPHINYWDFTNGKRGSGGISDAIPIIIP